MGKINRLSRKMTKAIEKYYKAYFNIDIVPPMIITTNTSGNMYISLDKPLFGSTGLKSPQQLYKPQEECKNNG